ncbi:MAG: LysR family transcriptional regulator [Bdellovibrionales bacterium]|nr:LysR family transcriptional regulator [Bdellovibrionales bacterium]
MPNFNHLYYFYITAKSGSTTAAAAHLRISQPSLSSQLKVLGNNLDVKLFRKVGRANQLTEAGSLVYGFCRRMFDVSEELNELIVERLPSAARRLNIGISNEVEPSFVVEVISHFVKQHGLVQPPKVNMISGHHEQLVERLRFRELDAVVTQRALSDPDLTNLMQADSAVALVCSSKWKIPKLKNIKKPAALRELFKEGDALWIMPSTNFKLRWQIDRFLEANKIKGRIVFESDVVASVVRSVVDEIGYALLPLIYIDTELPKKTLRVLGPKEGYWQYSIWLGCHNQSHDDPLILALSRAFKTAWDHSLQ